MSECLALMMSLCIAETITLYDIQSHSVMHRLEASASTAGLVCAVVSFFNVLETLMGKGFLFLLYI